MKTALSLESSCPQEGKVNDAELVRSKVEIRVHGDPKATTLVYLPGIHGDWTLAGGFRRALSGKLRFVETSYPLGAQWTHKAYAEAIVHALAEREIDSGWLLGESFGSQVAWEICRESSFRVEGIILAGGFVRHPTPRLAGLVYAATGTGTFRLLRMALVVYAQVARLRFGHSPETLAEIQEFVARRTRADFISGQHRLALVAKNDPRNIVASLEIPIFALRGFFDPIVPWRGVQRWLKRNCRAFRGQALIWRADHNVLGTAPKAAAEQVLQWISKQPMPDRP